jgi:hypothetical protein
LKNGIKVNGVNMIKRICAKRKSDVHNDISTILTMNSRAGCDMAEFPSPRPYHFPVHQARFVSSCLNSRVRNTAMRNFCKARWMAMIAMIPRTACDASQSSKNHCVVINHNQFHSVTRAKKSNLRRTRRKRRDQPNLRRGPGLP